MIGEINYSTGVIKRDPANINTHIEVVNLAHEPVKVCIFAFDWDTNPPVALPVLPGSPIVICPSKNQVFNVNLSEVRNNYEIRISLPECDEYGDDIIANVFALGITGNVITGNTILFRDLVRISACIPCNDCYC